MMYNKILVRHFYYRKIKFPSPKKTPTGDFSSTKIEYYPLMVKLLDVNYLEMTSNENNVEVSDRNKRM